MDVSNTACGSFEHCKDRVHCCFEAVKGTLYLHKLMAEMRHGEPATIALLEDTVLLKLGLKLRLITKSSSH